VRTLIGLRAMVGEERCSTFPGRLDLRKVHRMVFPDDWHRRFAWRTFAWSIKGKDPELAPALRAALRRDLWRSALRATFFDPAPPWMKRGLRSGRARLRIRRA
jgi:hypothetical protein